MTTDIEMIPLPDKKKKIEYEIKERKEEELEKKEKEESAKPSLMGSKLDPMEAIKSTKDEILKGVPGLPHVPGVADDKLRLLEFAPPMEEMGVPFGKEKDKIEKEIWKIAQDPEKAKEANDLMKDLASWTLTGMDVKKLHFQNEELDKLFAPVRTIDKYKDKAERFIIGFIPIAGGVMDIMEGIRGETYDGEKLNGTQRVTSVLVGAGSLALDCFTAGTSSVVKGGGKVALEAGEYALKEGTEAAAKTVAKEGAEAMAKTAAKEGAEGLAKTAAKEGAEGLGRNIFKESGEVASKEMFTGFSEYLAKNGGETGQKLAKWLDKANDLADKSPEFRKYLDESLTQIHKNKRGVEDLKKVSPADIVDVMEVLPVEIGEGEYKKKADKPAETAPTAAPQEEASEATIASAEGLTVEETREKADEFADEYAEWMDAEMEDAQAEAKLDENKTYTKEELLAQIDADMIAAREEIDKQKEVTPEMAEQVDANITKKLEEAGIETKIDKPQDAVDQIKKDKPELTKEEIGSLDRWGNTFEKLYNKDVWKNFNKDKIGFILDLFNQKDGLRMEDITNVGAMSGKFLGEGKEAMMAGIHPEDGIVTKALAMKNNVSGYLEQKAVMGILDAIPDMGPFKEIAKRFATVLMSMKHNLDFTQKPPVSLDKDWNPVGNLWKDGKYLYNKIGYIFGGLDGKKTLAFMAKHKEKLQAIESGKMKEQEAKQAVDELLAELDTEKETDLYQKLAEEEAEDAEK